jgi:hypothetical protein
MKKFYKITNRVGRTFSVAIGSVVKTTDNDGEQVIVGFGMKNGSMVIDFENEWAYADSVFAVVRK